MKIIRLLQLLLPLILWGLLFVPSSQSAIADEVFALKQIKKAIFEDPISRLSDWNADDDDPCDWSGIECAAARDHVVRLDLSDSSLEGFLAPELGSLEFLKELVLRGNSLRGVIPSQIGMLKSLEVLDLSMNRLSGHIPPEIGSLERITKINLRSNMLTGIVPLELRNLSNLVELRLDKNKLQGSLSSSNNSTLPHDIHDTNIGGALCLSQHLEIADFSYNFLVGKVPSCLSNLPSTSFQANCFQDESAPQRSARQCAEHQLENYHANTTAAGRYMKDGFDNEKAGQPKWLLILEIFTGSVVVAFMIAVIYTASRKFSAKSFAMVPWKWTTGTKDPIVISIGLDEDMLKHVPVFTRQQLEIACEDFSNIIGSSPDIILYKGILKDGPEIAVISLTVSENDWTTHHEVRFQRKVADVARINHENIAKLLGYCKEDNPFTRMLVFEYASNGTLYEYLHYGEGGQLYWTRRMKIVIGIARALRHLHNELQPPFFVSDLNSNSINLSEDFSPKLADIESWKSILSRSGKSLGYVLNGAAFHCFPDLPEGKQGDAQENAFAFGVILLEIVSGRPPYCKDRGSLVNWAVDYLDRPDMMCHLVDPELRYFRHDDLRIVCNAVRMCIQTDQSKRPSMREICAVMENGIDTSAAADLKESPLAWAELVLSS